jgi:iron complex outermembrane receptor protein
MFDTARVEVLRGPQGTLFGRNATGGLLHFVSVEPSEKPSAYVQASYSRFNTLNLEGALGGKIAEGVLGRSPSRATPATGLSPTSSPGGMMRAIPTTGRCAGNCCSNSRPPRNCA